MSGFVVGYVGIFGRCLGYGEGSTVLDLIFFARFFFFVVRLVLLYFLFIDEDIEGYRGF